MARRAKRDGIALYLAVRDPRVAWPVKAFAVLVAAYVLSPIDLIPDFIPVLGLLDDYPTRSGFVITPVVVWGGAACEFRPDPGEVASVHRVPLGELDSPAVPRLRRIPESDRPLISIPLGGTVRTDVHAPTAAVVYQFREVAMHGRRTRVAHYEQPTFAWR